MTKQAKSDTLIEEIMYDYWPDGQIAEKKQADSGETENYLWNGLALLKRAEERFIIEPHVTGGLAIAKRWFR